MTEAELTVAELERILDVKKRRLARLHRKRDQIERRLESVVEKISRIEGRAVPAGLALDPVPTAIPPRRRRQSEPRTTGPSAKL